MYIFHEIFEVMIKSITIFHYMTDLKFVKCYLRLYFNSGLSL